MSRNCGSICRIRTCRGRASSVLAENRLWTAQVASAAVQAEDLLAWYRAFQPDISEELSIDEMLTGNGTVSGWPLKLEDAHVAAAAGTLRVPGIAQPVRIGEIHGELRKGTFVIEPVRLSLSEAKLDATYCGESGKNRSKIARDNGNTGLGRNSRVARLCCSSWGAAR